MTTSTTHHCPGDCGQQVPRQRFACQVCWYRLPADLRRAITDNYRRNPGAHLLAMADAVDWYTEHPTRPA